MSETGHSDEKKSQRVRNLTNYIKGMSSRRDREDAVSVASNILREQCVSSQFTDIERAL